MMDTRSAHEPGGLKLTFSPDHCLLDEAPRVTVTGCRPGAPVTLQATTDLMGARHRAEAHFHADASGHVDPARDPSMGGNYTGIDPWGLWWSAEPVGPSEVQTPKVPVPSIVTATVEGRSATGEFARYWLSPGATIETVRDEGVWGLFARPAGEGPFPGIVAFGGSGGGLGPAAAWAPLLASHRFATLAIAFFGVPGFPTSLVGIDIEVVERACRWLLRRDDVSQRGVGVMGQSRGSELALLAGVLLRRCRCFSYILVSNHIQ